MRVIQEHSIGREQWLNLIRAACVTQTAGYPGAITVSKRFSTEVTAFEVAQFSRTALRMAEEYGLVAESSQDGNLLAVRVSRKTAEPAEPASEVVPVPATSQQRRHFAIPALLSFLHLGRPASTKEGLQL